MKLLLISAIILITESRGTEETYNLTARIGDTVNLTCDGMIDNSTWRIPDSNNKNKNIPFFDKSKRNSNINSSNIIIKVGEADTSHELIIFNFTTKNEGIYVCQVHGSSGFTMIRYKVSFETSSAEISSTLEPTTIHTYLTEKQTKSIKSPVLPIIAFGIAFLIMTVVVIAGRHYCSGMLPVKLDAFVSFCMSTEARVREREVDEETPQSEAVQNHAYESSQILVHVGVDHLHQRVQIQEISFGQNALDHNENSTDQNQSQHIQDDHQNIHSNLLNHNRTNGNDVSENRYQRNAIGLNYSEVLFQPGPSNHSRDIRGINERTVYSEINHLVKVVPLDDTDSDSSSCEDFVDMKDIKLSQPSELQFHCENQ